MFLHFFISFVCVNLLPRGTDFALSLLRRVELLAIRAFRVKMNNSEVEYTSILFRAAYASALETRLPRGNRLTLSSHLRVV